MKIKIVCDGGILAEVINAETGEVVPDVVGYTIEHRAGKIPRVTLNLEQVEFNVVGEEAD